METRAGWGRGVAVLCAILLAVGCTAQPPQGEGTPPVEAAEPEVAVAAARDEVIEAHQALTAAFASRDVEAFLALLEPTADLLIFHPRTKDRFAGIEEARTRLPDMFRRLDEARWLDVHPRVLVRGRVAWLTTHVLIESSTLEPAFVGRGTEIWLRGDDGWKLVHGHWSRNPEIETGS